MLEERSDRKAVGMSVLIELFMTFAKIGLFTFGGGYAMDGKYEELEKRVKNLEEMLKGFLQSEGNETHIQLDHCQGDLIVGDNCDINLLHCPVGTIIPGSIEDADSMIDDLECRVDDLNSEVDLLENRIDGAENHVEQLKTSLD